MSVDWPPPHASSATTTTFSIHHHRNVLLSNCQSFVPRLVSRLQSTVSQPPVILQSTTRYLGWSNAAASASELTHNSISMEWKIIMRMRRIAAATKFQFIFYDLPCITNSISLLLMGIFPLVSLKSSSAAYHRCCSAAHMWPRGEILISSCGQQNIVS